MVEAAGVERVAGVLGGAPRWQDRGHSPAAEFLVGRARRARSRDRQGRKAGRPPSRRCLHDGLDRRWKAHGKRTPNAGLALAFRKEIAEYSSTKAPISAPISVTVYSIT